MGGAQENESPDRRLSRVHLESEVRVQEEKKREEEKKSKKRAKPNMPVINEEAERALYEPFGAVEHSGMLLRFTSETLLDQDNYT